MNADDVALIKQYILHETLLTVLNRDKKAVNKSQIRIKEPYIIALEEAEKVVVQKMVEIKKMMGKQGVKILAKEITDNGTEVRYLARGYEGDCKFWGGNVRAEVWRLMDHYVFGRSDEEM